MIEGRCGTAPATKNIRQGPSRAHYIAGGTICRPSFKGLGAYTLAPSSSGYGRGAERSGSRALRRPGGGLPVRRGGRGAGQSNQGLRDFLGVFSFIPVTFFVPAAGGCGSGASSGQPHHDRKHQCLVRLGRSATRSKRVCGAIEKDAVGPSPFGRRPRPAPMRSLPGRRARIVGARLARGPHIRRRKAPPRRPDRLARGGRR